MKFFGGLSTQEIADVLDISLATVERKWATARIWLRREMKGSTAP
jgi:DNA-directed RNA polymerase specialized sigma24 family protein